MNVSQSSNSNNTSGSEPIRWSSSWANKRFGIIATCQCLPNIFFLLLFSNKLCMRLKQPIHFLKDSAFRFWHEKGNPKARKETQASKEGICSPFRLVKQTLGDQLSEEGITVKISPQISVSQVNDSQPVGACTQCTSLCPETARENLSRQSPRDRTPSCSKSQGTKNRKSYTNPCSVLVRGPVVRELAVQASNDDEADQHHTRSVHEQSFSSNRIYCP